MVLKCSEIFELQIGYTNIKEVKSIFLLMTCSSYRKFRVSVSKQVHPEIRVNRFALPNLLTLFFQDIINIIDIMYPCINCVEVCLSIFSFLPSARSESEAVCFKSIAYFMRLLPVFMLAVHRSSIRGDFN